MGKLQYEYYSHIKSRKIDWLWYPYIPYGKLTIIQGDPGEGKSTFILNVIALLTQGKTMPDGFEPGDPKVVIYQCAEDNVADTIKPRLEQAGTDCDKVAFILDDSDALTLSDERIDASIKKTGARLFVIDPIQAFIPQDADMQNATKMRSVLRKLAKVAEKNECAVVLIGHMNKGNGGKNLYRSLGSIDIAAIARSILMISRDVNNPQRRYMFPVKSSLAPEGKAIAFSFKEEGGLLWHGQCELSIDGEVNIQDIRLSKKEQARQLLISMLSERDMAAKEVYVELEDRGIQSRTVETVKKEIGVVTYKSGRTWFWKLPAQINDNIDNGGETDG